MTYTVQKYFTFKEFPSAEQAAMDLRTNSKEIREIWDSDRFQAALEKQGVIIRAAGDKELSVSQLLIANEILSSTNRKTIRQTMEVLKVTQAQYDGWLRDPVFQEYLRDKSMALLEASDYAGYRGLIRAVEAGDLKAIEMFFEMRGIYNRRITIDFNVQVMITKVIDVIARHVKDDNVMEAIARDIGELNAG